MFTWLSPDKLAARSTRHPWWVLGAWVVLLAVALFAASSVKVDEEQRLPGTDSARAEQLLEQLRGPDIPQEAVVVQSTHGASVDSPAFRAYVTALTSKLRALDGTVKAASNVYETGDASLVSVDKTETLIPVELTGKKVDAADTVDPLLDTIKAESNGDFRVITAGDGSIAKDISGVAKSDLKSAELIGIPAALVVLVMVFGAAAAAGVPIVLALLAIVFAAGLTALISQFTPVNSITTNMITMIGLAVGIDYTLFIVERFREERGRGAEKVQSIVTAGATASRAVLFSGITVMIALAGLFIVPSSTFHALAIGALTVVLGAVLAALTLLPAVLALLDRKINWLHLPGRSRVQTHEGSGGFFGRATELVMRHPVVSIVASVALLLAAAAPVVQMNIGNAPVDAMPADLASVKAFKVLDRDFSAGRIAPADVVIKGDLNSPKVQGSISELRDLLRADPAVNHVGDLETNADGTLGTMPVVLKGDPSSSEAADAVRHIRSDIVPSAFDGTQAEVVLGGMPASTTDYIDTMQSYLPIVMAFVLTLSFVLLMVVFRSIVIPVKAITMNLLSVGAAYGLLVLVFQHGVGADLFGFTQVDVIAAWLPVFLFTVLFGLSMDYHVFLLSRIQERFIRTRDNRASVAYGLRSTAHIITGAAAIMVAVFTGFALGDVVEIQQMGFGLAVAVFLDATIVRSVLVPASMEMLGEWNWYLPSWLGWLPRINVEGPRPVLARAPIEDVPGVAAG
jgi:RND superfamily putative drug exporter